MGAAIGALYILGIMVSALIFYAIIKNAVKEGTLEALIEYERIKREGK